MGMLRIARKMPAQQKDRTHVRAFAIDREKPDDGQNVSHAKNPRHTSPVSCQT